MLIVVESTSHPPIFAKAVLSFPVEALIVVISVTVAELNLIPVVFKT